MICITSLIITMNERPSKRISPVAFIIPSTFTGNLFFVTISTAKVISLPPSSAGIGRRFINPRFMLIRSVILRSDATPARAASPIALDIPTGPETAESEYLPVIGLLPTPSTYA